MINLVLYGFAMFAIGGIFGAIEAYNRKYVIGFFAGKLFYKNAFED